MLVASLSDGYQATILELPSGKFAGSLPYCPDCLDPQGTYWTIGVAMHDEPRGLWLFRRGKSDPLLGLGLGMVSTLIQPQFDATGTLLAWGTDDGTVSIADIPEIQRQLAKFGLDWQ